MCMEGEDDDDDDERDEDSDHVNGMGERCIEVNESAISLSLDLGSFSLIMIYDFLSFISCFFLGFDQEIN